MQCQTCGVELPADARFCIECGAAVVAPANTGATTALPRYGASAVRCRACGADSPEGADYCVRCGRRLGEAPPPQPAPAPLGAPVAGVPYPAAPARPRRLRRRDAGRVSGAIFLIGLGLLLLLKLPFWPMILVVAGLSSFASAAIRGRVVEGLTSVLWLFGLAFLFSVPRLFVPGMIVLVGLSVLITMGRRRCHWP